MLRDRIEAKWIDTFAHVFETCQVKNGDVVAVVSESQSRQINVHLAELALLRLGARIFHIVLPTPPQDAPVPVRSTGSSFALGGLEPVVRALSASSMVVDLTVEGLMHAQETPGIRKDGARVLYVSNEHPEVLERLRPDPEIKARVRRGRELMLKARTMHVASEAGSDLHVEMTDAVVGGNVGFVDEPGQMASWPGGICSCFPRAGAVNGVLVLAEGDINLTFKRYLERPITLVIENDFVREIRGVGVDADLMRAYFEAWRDENSYGTSHVGWGMNHGARWESLVLYDKGEVNGTEQRAFAGNFLFSTGVNPAAGRRALGHYDLPVRGCTIKLDDRVVADRGKLVGDLA